MQTTNFSILTGYKDKCEEKQNEVEMIDNEVIEQKTKSKENINPNSRKPRKRKQVNLNKQVKNVNVCIQL